MNGIDLSNTLTQGGLEVEEIEDLSTISDLVVVGEIVEIKKHPWFVAVQFHPEAAPGPFDCKFIFEELKQIMESKK